MRSTGDKRRRTGLPPHGHAVNCPRSMLHTSPALDNIIKRRRRLSRPPVASWPPAPTLKAAYCRPPRRARISSFHFRPSTTALGSLRSPATGDFVAQR
ncbi:hypothetical protein DTO164E3_5198 [Paecilomyces variotii]|nr:hypothetical protein DTO164E3_5198 [Paecilomyces variotii]KAJ9224714.1 hypothetical protein DTO169C6_2965 [Paecilomyces variotii]KAJ9245346.1 hypothetical protein DTO169E5_651 [Paecilomyces variotii]KAJ9253768.1 hypothetical protein DTO207G8_3900 [Paecilomyces variotii]KAJ9265546.1 hypothetical protein DTO195F2_1585 [Paecilomyces variotii]